MSRSASAFRIFSLQTYSPGARGRAATPKGRPHESSRAPAGIGSRTKRWPSSTVCGSRYAPSPSATSAPASSRRVAIATLSPAAGVRATRSKANRSVIAPPRPVVLSPASRAASRRATPAPGVPSRAARTSPGGAITPHYRGKPPAGQSGTELRPMRPSLAMPGHDVRRGLFIFADPHAGPAGASWSAGSVKGHGVLGTRASRPHASARSSCRPSAGETPAFPGARASAAVRGNPPEAPSNRPQTLEQRRLRGVKNIFPPVFCYILINSKNNTGLRAEACARWRGPEARPGRGAAVAPAFRTKGRI